MSDKDVQLDRFIRKVRQRLGTRALARAAVWSLLGASAVMLVVALYFVAQGYAVERRWYAIVVVLGAAAALGGWLVNLGSDERAARFADSFYGLHDALVSWLHFSRRRQTEGFYALQAEQAAALVEGLDARRIDWRPARVPTVLSLLLAAVAVALAWKQPSAAVEQRLALEATVAAQTDSINEELKDLVTELNASTTDDERELIEPDKLRQMVDQLETTRDQKEALRQYARLEDKLNQSRAKLEQRRDEHVLQTAARELEKARDTKPLAEKLSQKKYDEAAQELRESQPDAKKPLSEQQKELARLRAAGQRMAAAARGAGPSAASAAGQSSQSAASSASRGAQGSSGSASGGGGSSGGELENSIQELDSAVEQWDAALAEAARQEKASGQCDAQAAGQCAACQQKAGEKLNKLAKYMEKMAIKRRANDKLCKLCDACSQCQGGLCQSDKSGKKAGWGTDESRRDQRDELVDNGQTEALQGIKGQGPSQTTVEAAEDGSGVSSRPASSPARTYRRQYESFVSREDVPEQVKSGVRNYFESIHKIEDQTQEQP
jgi:uncharacterized membrane protein YgcG